ncbi:MAG: hypothetical protein KVP17_004695, partial [Porospora cf. gigantea B]|uniref:uncharacterized protein n=2 Tax=Porospora cf. gigantea B TaxID=2853592 RepID=UPI003571D064
MPELEDLIERFGGRKSRSSTVGTAADGPPPRQPTMATKISSVPDRTPGPRQPQHSRPSVPRLPLTSRLPSRQPVDPSAQGRQTERRPTESGTVVHRPLGREPRAISSRDHGHVPASNASIFGQRTVPAEYQAPFTSKPSETSDAISSHRRIRRNTTTLLLDESDNYTPQPDTHASYRKITSESMLSDAEDFVGSVKALDKVPAACPTPFISRTKQPNVVCLQDRPEITPRTQRLLEEQLTVMARQLEMVQEAEIDRRVEQSIAAERAAAVEGRNLMSDEVHQASGEWGEVLAIKRAKLHTAFKDREKEFLEQHRQREEGLRQANSSLRSDLLEASRQASRLQADMTKKSEQIAKKEQHIVELHKRLHEEKSKVSQLTKAAVQHSNETVRLMRTVEYLKNRSKQDSRLSQAAEQRMKEMKDKVDEQFTVLTAKYETAMRRNEQETETFKNHFVTRLCDSLGVRVPANTSVSATADTGEIASLVKRQVVSRIMRKQEQALQQRVQEELDKNHAVIQATADAEVRRRLQELKATRVVKTVLPGDLVRLKAQIEAEVRERIRGEIKARLLHVDVLGLLNSPESESNPEGIAEVLFGGGLTDRSVETAEGKPQPRVSTLSAAAARRSKGDQVAARSTPSAPPAKPSILELLPPGQRVASSNLALFNHKLTVRTIRAREDTMERGRPYQTRAESGRFKTVTAIHSGGAPATQSRSRAVPQRQGLLVPLCVHNMARAKGVKRVRRRRAGKLDIVKLQELSVAGTPGFMLDEGEPAAVPSISVVETQRSVKPEAGMADDEPSRWLKAEAAPPGVIKSKGRPPGPPPRSTKWPRSKGKPPGPPPKSVK